MTATAGGRCRAKFADMRCELTPGHMISNPPVPHANGEWRWNKRAQWTQPPLPPATE